MCERALGTDVVASISGLAGSAATSGGAGQFRGSAAATFLLLYLAPPCPVKVPAMGQTEGVTEPPGPQVQEVGCRDSRGSSAGSTSCLPYCLIQLIQLCPSSNFSGSKTGKNCFLFNGHWKNSGLIFFHSLISSLYLGTLDFLKA